MPPPHLDNVSIVVPIIEDTVEFGVQRVVSGEVGEIQFFDFGLDVFKPLDVGVRYQSHKPARQIRLDQDLDLANVAHEFFVDATDASAAIGAENHEALSPQLLERLAYRIRTGTIAHRERADLEPFVRGKTPLNNILPDQLVDAARLKRGQARTSGRPCRALHDLVHSPTLSARFAIRQGL